MTSDVFADRLDRVRGRFVSSLQGKIEGAYASIPKLAVSEPTAAAALAETYRSMHGLVGVGPAVGFPATARAARDAEDVLRPAQNDRRGITAEEISEFEKRLDALCEAAMRELQFYRGLTKAE